jgi:hypothetical protein
MIPMNRHQQVYFGPCLGVQSLLSLACVATLICPFKTIYMLSFSSMYPKCFYIHFWYYVPCLDDLDKCACNPLYKFNWKFPQCVCLIGKFLTGMCVV